MRSLSYSLIISNLLLIFLLAEKSNSAVECSIQNSIYRDVNGKGFELVFEAIEPSMGSVSSTLSIGYSGEVMYQFDLSQTMGYGSFSASQAESNLLVNFFNGDLTSDYPSFIDPRIQGAQLMFISGLGSFDYYQRGNLSPNVYPPLIGDTAWTFDRCK